MVTPSEKTVARLFEFARTSIRHDSGLKYVVVASWADRSGELYGMRVNRKHILPNYRGAHAEERALKVAIRPGSALLVARFNRRHIEANRAIASMAAPCAVCAKLVKNHKVYYTDRCGLWRTES